jgi:cytochrome c553
MVVIQMIKVRLFLFFVSISLFLLISSLANAADPDAGRVTATQCAICHGINGEGNGAPQSCIACIDADVFIKHINDFKSGVRKNVMMERFVKNLSDEDIENLAAYYATKSF